MDSPAEFLNRAIEENQLTIRAVDVKVTALLAAMLLPLAGIARIFKHLEGIYNLWPHWTTFAVSVIFLLMWLLALACLVMAIGAIDNPAVHIPNALAYKGSFYSGGLFKLKPIDAILNRRDVMAIKNPTDVLNNLPKTPEEILSELVFEQMKLAYIRDIKLNRLRWGFKFAGGWLFTGICIYLASKYLPGKSFW